MGRYLGRFFEIDESKISSDTLSKIDKLNLNNDQQDAIIEEGVRPERYH